MSELFDQLLDDIKSIRETFNSELAQVQNTDELEQVRIQYLSRKGRVQALFGNIGKVETDERPKVGAELNKLRGELEALFGDKKKALETQSVSIQDFDPTLPGRRPPVGTEHPLMLVLSEIKSIFKSIGFRVEVGKEIETDYYNFEALNIPPYHPSRDMHDTFYLGNEYLLRTHTSPVQIHTMEEQKPPIRMIAPGRCFRKDTPDATHSPIFYQVEGLCVDKGVSFADLRGVVQAFAHKLLGSNVKVRFRPSYFPFTEPSAEYDFSCIFCNGKGCRFCKQTGWLEISGAGMVDPNVFRFVDYDPDVYSGYAFGMGVERIALLLYGIPDIRIFFENDKRFLTQF